MTKKAIKILTSVALTLSIGVPMIVSAAANYMVSGSVVQNGLHVDLSGTLSANTYTGQANAQHVSVNWDVTNGGAWTTFMNQADFNFINNGNNGIIGNTLWNISHTYSVAGTYTIKVVFHHANVNGNESGSQVFQQTVIVKPQCSDGVDNDNDGFVDFASDPGCSSLTDDDEFNAAPVNQPPAIDPIAPLSGNELSNIPFDANATDPEGDTLTYSIPGAPAGSSINSTTGVFSWVPSETQGPGVYNFNVCVGDGLNVLVCTPVQITVNEVNQAPQVSDHNLSTHMNMILPISLVGSDSDFPIQSLSFSIVSNPVNGILQFLGVNNYQYVPDFGFVGSDSFTYKANDGLADSNIGTINISINNDAPIIYTISDVTTPELSPVVINASATDPNPGDTLTYSFSGSVPTGLSIDSSTGVMTWTPTESQGPGSYPVSIIVSDGAAQNSTSFNIIVTELNEAPSAQDGNASTAENTPVMLTLVATDTDIPAQNLTFTIDTQPASGSLGAISGNQVEYTPNSGFTGSDSFKFVANDGSANSNIAEVSITVSDLPACSDGIDNDQDNLADAQDPGCVDPTDNDETDPVIPPTPAPTAQCSDGIDNDNDGLVDANDPGCIDAQDNDETHTSSGGNGGGGSSSSSGGHRRDISGISGGGGEVLGAFDEAFCTPYLSEYIGLHKKNNTEEVKKLEVFLNKYMGANVPVDGVYDTADFAWVEKFQNLYNITVLEPWTLAGHPTNGPTGYVYKTTKRWVNILMCPELIGTTPIPALP